ncbi:MAG TPA: hypothetical protein VGL19_02645 [Polyangiaceae bacterium]
MVIAGFRGYRTTTTSWLALAFGLGLTLSACGSSSSPGAVASGGSPGQAGTNGSQSGAVNAPGGNSAGGAPSAGAPGAAGASTETAGAAGSAAGGAGAAGGSAGGAAGGSSGSGGSGGSGGATIDPSTLDKFSFFVTSMVAMRRLAKSDNGFGGDLRYGQADGLSGADKICSEIAESSMPGAAGKKWHAFLSTSKVNAAVRIGAGPWYDRNQRLVAQTLADLLQDRPNGANAAIKQDLPNETGTPNHRPDPTKPEDDNHHTLTGSNAQGMLYGPTSTCMDWTSNSRDNQATGRPRIGFSWSISNRTNWISGQDEGGCGAGVAVEENPGSDPSNPIVGSGGGYGGIYCFAMMP